MYVNVVKKFVKLDGVEGLKKQDIKKDPIIRDSISDLWILVNCTLCKSFAPLILVGHTSNQASYHEEK